MKDKLKRVIKELIPYIIILLVVVLIRSYIVTPVMVSGTSMSPTLKGHEIMILNKLDKKYSRFEIVVLKTNHEDIIKRVIGLPGETISCENNIIYINSHKLEDKYGLVLDGIYDDVYLIMDMVIDSNLTKEGRNLFWNAYYESNIRDSETLWEIVKNNYNYEPTE